MPAISNPDTPPSSPPRKKLKFSLKLKNRTKKLREGKGTTQDKAKLYPIFSRTPSKKQPISVGTETSTDNTEFGQPPPPYTGLKNLGNTCYLNVILQVLRYSPEFTHAVEQLDHDLQTNQESGEENEDTSEMEEQKAQEESRNNVVKALHELFVKMSSVEEEYAETGNFTEGGELAVEPDDFINIFSELNPMYSGHFQHDAQEFLSSLLMNIQESMDSLKPRQQTQNLKIDSCSSPATSLKSSPFLSDAVRMKGGRKLDLATETNQSNNCMSPSKKHGSSSFISQNCASPATPKKLPTCNVASDLLKCKTSQQDTVDLISSLFQGRLTLQTKCLDCEKSHERFEDFQDVSIPVQKQSVDYTDKKQACLSPDHDMDKPVDLAWGLSQFASVERLTGEDKYFCDDCSRLTEAEINTKFQALPQILTIHLKRFTATSFGLSQGWVSKITSTLETPTDISLEQWCTRTCKYRQEHFELLVLLCTVECHLVLGTILHIVKCLLLNQRKSQVNI